MEDGGGLGFLITDLSGGGAERVVATLSESLTEHRRELFLFRDRRVYDFHGAVHVADVPLFCEGGAGEPRALMRSLNGFRRLRRWKRERHLDRCVSFLTWPNLFNVMTRRGEQVILSVRNNPSRAVRGTYAPWIKALMRTLYRRADHVVAISEDVRRDLIENFRLAPTSVTTIYNPICLPEVEALARRPVAPGLDSRGRPTVITIGRLAIQKGQWHLIRAFSEVRRTLPEARLVVVGDGPLRGALSELARDLGCGPDDVVFPGFLDNPFPLLAASEIFAFPSLWEGLGNVVIEALALGVPVVTADCHSGPREILTGDPGDGGVLMIPEDTPCGVLMPSCDGVFRGADEPLTDAEARWAGVLEELLSDPRRRRRYGEAGRRRAKDFALEPIADQWRRLLLRLDQERSCSSR